MTSGSGSSSRTESRPPQTAVLPHVLTHLIEGFVIQEGNQPFPVERPSFSIESLKRHPADSKMDGFSAKELKVQQEPVLTCELCGRVDFAYIFKRSKRFCSNVCAKRYNVGCTKRMGLFPNRKATLENLRKERALNEEHRNSNGSLESQKAPPTAAASPSPQGDAQHSSDLSVHKPPPSPLTQQLLQEPRLPPRFLPSDPGQWNIQHVYQFISSLPGCLDIAEEFRGQEIDGQALLLLKEDHLMGTMNIKLGPALKIFAQISMLRDS